MSHKERTRNRTEVFTGNIFSVHVDEVELENGKLASREVIEHDGGVCVLAINDQQELYLVKQFRYPFQTELYELPAGKRNGNEDPRLCGIRELKEETGLQADCWTPLTMMISSPGCFSEVIYIYLATGLHQVDQQLDEDEFLDVFKISLPQALAMIERGELLDGKSQLAILKYWQLLNTPLPIDNPAPTE